MNYLHKIENLAQKSDHVANGIQHLMNDIEKDGLSEDDINWVLSRLSDIQNNQIEIQKVLNEKVQEQNYWETRENH